MNKDVEISGLITELCNTGLEGMLYDSVMQHVERALMYHAMRASKYNQSKCARLLGISRGNLRMKLQKYYPGEFC